MSRYRRRAVLGTAGAGLVSLSGCLGLLSGDSTGTAKVNIVRDQIEFEPNGATLSGQVAASDPAAVEFTGEDSFNSATGSFTVTGTDRDVIAFAPGTLQSVAFTVDGDATATVFHSGALLEEETEQFSHSFGTATPTASPSPTPSPTQTPTETPTETPTQTPTPEPTPEPRLIDDFESQDLSAYTQIPAGKPWQIASNHVANGRTNLYTSGSHYYGLFSMPGDGLANYPEAGDTIRGTMGAEGADNLSVSFGIQSLSGNDAGQPRNGYMLTISDYNQNVKFGRVSNGQNTKLVSQSASIPHFGTYDVTIKWGTDGLIDVTVNESGGDQLASFTVVDGTYTDGGFGYRIGDYRSSVAGWWDHWRIE